MPRLSDTAIRVPAGPLPSTRRVTDWPSPLSMTPIMEAAVASRPRAAVTTAEVRWISSIRETISVDRMASTITDPSPDIACCNVAI